MTYLCVGLVCLAGAAVLGVVGWQWLIRQLGQK